MTMRRSSGGLHLQSKPHRTDPLVGWSWKSAVRWLVGSTCDGCGTRLRVGVGGPLCLLCELEMQPVGVWRTGPASLPILAGWRYGGAIAECIVAAKFRSAPLDVERWLGGLTTGLCERIQPSDLLLPIAPHRRRLRQRGWHLPDELARAICANIRGAARPTVHLSGLKRLDDAAPRSRDDSALPTFTSPLTDGAVWLVDDVVTSGVTLARAAEVLVQQGVHVRGALCLADAGGAEAAGLGTSRSV